jgi:hypothetical protein
VTDWTKVDIRVVLIWLESGHLSLDSGGMLTFPTLVAGPGLYRLTMPATPPDRTRVYIGETSDLRRRMTVNYRSPDRTQQTNLRVNALLRDHLSRGGRVELATATQATVHLTAHTQPLDLTIKSGRLLAESAAVVSALLAGDADIVNLG